MENFTKEQWDGANAAFETAWQSASSDVPGGELAHGENAAWNRELFMPPGLAALSDPDTYRQKPAETPKRDGRLGRELRDSYLNGDRSAPLGARQWHSFITQSAEEASARNGTPFDEEYAERKNLMYMADKHQVDMGRARFLLEEDMRQVCGKDGATHTEYAKGLREKFKHEDAFSERSGQAVSEAFFRGAKGMAAITPPALIDGAKGDDRAINGRRRIAHAAGRKMAQENPDAMRFFDAFRDFMSEEYGRKDAARMDERLRASNVGEHERKRLLSAYENDRKIRFPGEDKDAWRIKDSEDFGKKFADLSDEGKEMFVMLARGWVQTLPGQDKSWAQNALENVGRGAADFFRGIGTMTGDLGFLKRLDDAKAALKDEKSTVYLHFQNEAHKQAFLEGGGCDDAQYLRKRLLESERVSYGIKGMALAAPGYSPVADGTYDRSIATSNAPGKFSIELTPGQRTQVAAVIKHADDTRDAERWARNFGENIFDSAEGDNFFTKKILNPALRSSVYTLVAGVPYVGIPLVSASLAGEALENYMDQEIGFDQALLMAIPAGVGGAFVERLQFKTMFGAGILGKTCTGLVGKALPGFMSSFEARLAKESGKYLLGGGMQVLKNGAKYGTINWAKETVQERTQDAVPLLIQSIGRALDADIPEAQWTEFWRDFGPQTMDTALALLPLVVLGISTRVSIDAHEAKELFQWKEGLNLVGLRDDVADQIMAETDPGKQIELFREAWPNRDMSLAREKNLELEARREELNADMKAHNPEARAQMLARKYDMEKIAEGKWQGDDVEFVEQQDARGNTVLSRYSDSTGIYFKSPDGWFKAEQGSLVAVDEKLSRSLNEKVASTRMRKVTASSPLHEQLAAVGHRYENSPLMNRAPDGTASKLSSEEWAAARTEGFKREFGDWEKAASRRYLEGPPVASITGNEVVMQKGLADVVMAFILRKRGKTEFENPTLGSVKFKRQSVKSSISKGIGSSKAAAFAAIDTVIEKGVVIDFQKNWKGRGYDTAVIAAPVNIGGEVFVVEAVVERRGSGNKFYVHEVMQRERLGNAFQTRHHPQNANYPSATPASLENILHEIFSVKDSDIKTALTENGEPTSEVVRAFMGRQSSRPGGGDGAVDIERKSRKALEDLAEHYQRMTGLDIRKDLDAARTLQDDIDAGLISAEAAYERITTAAKDPQTGVREGMSPADIRVLGSNARETRDGVSQDVVRLYRGATPQTLVEEYAEAHVKKRLDEGEFRDGLRQWKADYERETGRREHGDSDGDLIEWFSARAVDYTLSGKEAEASMPKSVGEFFKAMREYFKAIIERALVFGKMIEDGKVDERFEQELREATGMEQAKYDHHLQTAELHYSMKQTRKSVLEQIALFDAKGFTGQQDFKFGKTPQVISFLARELKMDATGDAPLHMKQNRLGHIRRHNLTNEEIADALKQCHDPAMVFRSKKFEGNRLAVLTDVISSHDGNPIMVIFELGSHDSTDYKMIVSDIVTATGKNAESLQDWIWSEKNQETQLCYMHTERASQLADYFGIDVPTRSTLEGGSFYGKVYTQNDIRQVERSYSLNTFNEKSTARAESSRADVEHRYRGTKDWHKAPNGRKSKLTEEQWVTVRTPEFKRWSNDWKDVVKGPDGEPLVLYHGARAGGFTTFQSGMNRGKPGFYFSDRWNVAKGYSPSKEANPFHAITGGIYDAYLKMKNPRVMEGDGGRWNNLDGLSTEEWVKESMNAGHDGLIVRNVYDNGRHGGHALSNVYVAFDPKQIKSASKNRGAFDGRKADITYSLMSGDAALKQSLEKLSQNYEYKSARENIESQLKRARLKKPDSVQLENDIKAVTDGWAGDSANIDAAAQEYIGNHTDKQTGRIVIDPDKSRYLVPGYTPALVNGSRKAGNAIAYKAWEQALASGKPKKIVLVTGNPGAGKGYVMDTMNPDAYKNADIVFDAALSKFENVKRMLDAALAHGHEVTIIQVYNTAERSFINAIERGVKTGRLFPFDEFIDLYTLAEGKVSALEEYISRNPNKEKITTLYIDNSGKSARKCTVENAKKWEYSINKNEFTNITNYINENLEGIRRESEGAVSELDPVAIISRGLQDPLLRDRLRVAEERRIDRQTKD